MAVAGAPLASAFKAGAGLADDFRFGQLLGGSQKATEKAGPLAVQKYGQGEAEVPGQGGQGPDIRSWTGFQ
jgi:hypothetical protein